MSETAKAIITQGNCMFCDQPRMVDQCDTQEEADQLATEECDCPEAKKRYPSDASKQDLANKREKTLKDAKQDLDDLFGEKAEEDGEISVEPDIIAIFYTLAERVYDEYLRSVTITITQGVRAKISKTDKGKLIIQRDNSSSVKREYKD